MPAIVLVSSSSLVSSANVAAERLVLTAAGVVIALLLAWICDQVVRRLQSLERHKVWSVGDIFAGRYELVDPLGEGGAGVVWRVWDWREQQYLAAKVLRQVDAASLLRFIREQALRIEDPHVLTPIGWAGEDDKVLFTMPIVRGGSVATLIGDFGPLPVSLTTVLLDQTLSALERIHSQKVVHRDVKPANLLLDATGRGWPHLWLSDFGVAAGVDEPRLTRGPVTLGTDGYLAPECRHPGWDPDPRADLYAVGMAALEMLTGQRPQSVQPLDLLRDVAAPESLIALIRGLGEFDPQRRIATATQARQQLAATGLLPEAGPQDGGGPTVLGEVEVFDQVPELPAGWTQTGPVSAPGDTAYLHQNGPHPAGEVVPDQTGEAAPDQTGEAAPDQADAAAPDQADAAAPGQTRVVRSRRGLALAALLMISGGALLLWTALLAWG